MTNIIITNNDNGLWKLNLLRQTSAVFADLVLLFVCPKDFVCEKFTSTRHTMFVVAVLSECSGLERGCNGRGHGSN